MGLEDLEIYQIAMELGEKCWKIVIQWDNFSKFSIGNQLTRSADSVAANISEGFGRFHYGEKKHFSYYARGSLFETKTWITKSFNRNLISEKVYNELMVQLKNLSVKLNNYIKSIGVKK